MILLTSIILSAFVYMIFDLVEDAVAKRRAYRLELKAYEARTAQDNRKAAEANRDTAARHKANDGD